MDPKGADTEETDLTGVETDTTDTTNETDLHSDSDTQLETDDSDPDTDIPSGSHAPDIGDFQARAEYLSADPNLLEAAMIQYGLTAYICDTDLNGSPDSDHNAPAAWSRWSDGVLRIHTYLASISEPNRRGATFTFDPTTQQLVLEGFLTDLDQAGADALHEERRDPTCAANWVQALPERDGFRCVAVGMRPLRNVIDDVVLYCDDIDPSAADEVFRVAEDAFFARPEDFTELDHRDNSPYRLGDLNQNGVEEWMSFQGGHPFTVFTPGAELDRAVLAYECPPTGNGENPYKVNCQTLTLGEFLDLTGLNPEEYQFGEDLYGFKSVMMPDASELLFIAVGGAHSPKKAIPMIWRRTPGQTLFTPFNALPPNFETASHPTLGYVDANSGIQFQNPMGLDVVNVNGRWMLVVGVNVRDQLIRDQLTGQTTPDRLASKILFIDMGSTEEISGGSLDASPVFTLAHSSLSDTYPHPPFQQTTTPWMVNTRGLYPPLTCIGQLPDGGTITFTYPNLDPEGLICAEVVGNGFQGLPYWEGTSVSGLTNDRWNVPPYTNYYPNNPNGVNEDGYGIEFFFNVDQAGAAHFYALRDGSFGSMPSLREVDWTGSTERIPVEFTNLGGLQPRLVLNWYSTPNENLNPQISLSFNNSGPGVRGNSDSVWVNLEAVTFDENPSSCLDVSVHWNDPARRSTSHTLCPGAVNTLDASVLVP